ncbi:MAG: PAS domain S-box protein [Methylicorpusculum sp.]|uniref:PAS domain S-box protein n=1 Tax=Methylicorpusculum sp. TaxID=2713644 RepID=UPI0027263751|nr:PAS domain S-box protein [Methylicorpusculum sp.]MDO8939032.1 PAS domain S-box protein [Methylicorpusculum sp.]MDP2202951.1 PAS domain S-box protein [Methylicorpusculum sp.]
MFDYAKLAQLSRSRILFYAITSAMVATSLIVAAMDHLLNGEVSVNYLITGLVASFCVSAIVSTLLIQLAKIQSNLIKSQSETLEKQGIIKELQTTQHLLQTIIETLPIRVSWKDKDLRYVGCNQLFAKNAGLDHSDEITAKDDFQLSWKKNAERYHADEQQVISTHCPQLGVEEHQTTPDGREICLRTSKIPLLNNDGTVLGLLSIYEDITPLQKIMQELWLTQTAIAKSRSSFYRIDSHGKILYANDHVCEALGYSREEIIGQPVWQFDPDFAAQDWPPMWENLKQQGYINIETRHRRKDGSIFPVEVVGNYIVHNGGEYTFTFVQDISDRKEIEQSLRLTQFAMDNASIGIYWIDQRTRICYANKRACEMLGYSEEQLLKLSLADIDPVFPFQNWQSAWQELKKNKTRIIETLHQHRDSHLLTVEITANHVQFGETEYSVAFVSDITDRKLAEEKLQLAARVFGEAHEGIIITDALGNMIDVNPTFCEITGYSREQVIGKNPRILNSGKHSDLFFADIWLTLAKQNYWQGEVWNRKKNGELYAELLSISVLRDTQGRVVNYIGLFSDITESKHQQLALERLAHFDPLTQLPNRTLFGDRFNQAISHSKRNHSLLAICFVDLDGFKPVNDKFGHDTGDQVLIQVAERIKTHLREEDTVSRLGGDEFALLIGEMDSIDHCCQTMIRIHKAISEAYYINHQVITISASSGITLYPLDDSAPDTLIRHADHAMYQAKLAGKNRFHLFDNANKKDIIRLHSQLDEIADAFQQGQFCLYYQPKVNMQTGHIFGMESLLRWQHPSNGLITPEDFLYLVQCSQLEITIGNWVIEQALDQLDQWLKQGLNLELSINISYYQLLNSDFISHLTETLAKHPAIASKNLQLELLESTALGDLNAVAGILNICSSQLGVKIALDDFGAGYSSLTHMRHLPADTIKLDYSFVRNMLTNTRDDAIITGVIALSHAFKRQVIAEGVETVEQGLHLLALDCQLAQGFAIAAAMPPESIINWIASYRGCPEWHDFNPDKI